MEIVLLVILLIVFSAFAVDFYHNFNIWQRRIHIGRINDDRIWALKVKDISEKWLKKTPTIKLTDNSRLLIIDMLRGNYKRNAIQNWQQASLLLGLTQYFRKSKDENTKKRINQFLNATMDSSGNWKQQPKEIDGVILSYAILDIDWIDHEKYRPAFDEMWKLIQSLIGKDGTVMYRRHMNAYRYVDTIGFICPFLIHYGIKFQNEEAIELACLQIREFNTNGMYPEHFLPCHTYNVDSKICVGLFGWGRGLGWYAIGLIDSWNALPANHPRYDELTKSVLQFAKMAMPFQNKNGSWNWLVTDSSSRNDSSATATIVWFLQNAAAITEITAACESSANKGVQYLKSVTQRNGAVDYSQGDTKGIGIHSTEFGIMPFTQGFVLRIIHSYD